MRNICIGGIYKHFKGNLYLVEKIAYDSETTNPMVVYQDLYDSDKSWVRSLDTFLGEVDHEKYPNVTQTYRFELIADKYNAEMQQKLM